MKSGSLVLVMFFGLVVLVLFGWLGFYAYQQRLGPALNSTPVVVFVTSAPQQVSLPVPTVPPSATPAPAAPPASAQGSVCGETTAWNMLFLGSGADGRDDFQGADFIWLLRADFPNRRATLYAFPRNLLVDTSGLGLTNSTANAALLGNVFYQGRIRSLQFPYMETLIDGTRMTARVIQQNFSLPTDHYFIVEQNSIPVLVDTLGGVPLYVPERVADTGLGVIILPGQQVLTGNQVLAYAGMEPSSEFSRLQRQKALAEALCGRLLEPASIARLPELYRQNQQLFATDLSFEQINHLTCLLQDPQAVVLLESIRPEMTSFGPQGSLYWDRNLVNNQLGSLGLIP